MLKRQAYAIKIEREGKYSIRTHQSAFKEKK
jgi:hypothetical protein